MENEKTEDEWKKELTPEQYHISINKKNGARHSFLKVFCSCSHGMLRTNSTMIVTNRHTASFETISCYFQKTTLGNTTTI